MVSFSVWQSEPEFTRFLVDKSYDWNMDMDKATRIFRNLLELLRDTAPSRGRDDNPVQVRVTFGTAIRPTEVWVSYLDFSYLAQSCGMKQHKSSRVFNRLKALLEDTSPRSVYWDEEDEPYLRLYASLI